MERVADGSPGRPWRRAPGRRLAPRLSLLILLVGGCEPYYDPEAARALFADQCARCHGVDGRGERRLAVLSSRLDLTDSALLRRGPRASRRIRSVIAEGYGTMPGFEHRLEPRQIDQLTAFVIELARTANPTGEGE